MGRVPYLKSLPWHRFAAVGFATKAIGCFKKE